MLVGSEGNDRPFHKYGRACTAIAPELVAMYFNEPAIAQRAFKMKLIVAHGPQLSRKPCTVRPSRNGRLRQFTEAPHRDKPERAGAFRRRPSGPAGYAEWEIRCRLRPCCTIAFRGRHKQPPRQAMLLGSRSQTAPRPAAAADRREISRPPSSPDGAAGSACTAAMNDRRAAARHYLSCIYRAGSGRGRAAAARWPALRQYAVIDRRARERERVQREGPESAGGDTRPRLDGVISGGFLAAAA